MTEAATAQDEQQGAAPQGTRFGAYLFANGAWFLAFGVQVVLFPYLVRVILQEDEVRFGIAQMALQLPTALFILVGGFVADRVDGRRAVFLSYLIAVATFSLLGGLVVSGALTYGLILFYALTVGTMSAFNTPARDALLSQVAPSPDAFGIQKAVSLALLSQFGGQLIGMALAAAAPFFGVGALLLGQAVLMAVSAYLILRVRPRPRLDRHARGDEHLLVFMARQIGGGFTAALSSREIAPVMICSTAMGLCFMGSFFVLLPLIVEGIFRNAGADPEHIASALGIFSFCFWSGSMISALALMRFGRNAHRGRLYLGALATGGVVLMLCSIPVSFPLLCVLNFVWGLGGGVAMTLGRAIVQQHAPDAMRARILSIFTLTLMLAGPLGALGYGFLARAIGPHQSVLFPGALMLVIVSCVYLFTGLGKAEPARA